MGSSGKKKTTMAKLARENRLRERRLNKQAKRDARRQASADNAEATDRSEEAGTARSISPSPPPAAIESAATDSREAGADEPASNSTGTEQPIVLPRVEADDPSGDIAGSDEPSHEATPAASSADQAVQASPQADRMAADPRDKEVALLRLREAPDEELAVFERRLRDDALEAGATEQEMRHAQRDHPGHSA